MTTAQIISGCKRGDSQAWECFYKKFHRLLMHVCLKHTRDYYLAQDICQEIMIKIYQGIGTLVEEQAISGWIYNLARNTAISYIRKKTIRRYYHNHDCIDYVNEQLIIKADPECDLTTGELLHVIDTLPPGMKKVFRLYAIQGYKHHEIAHMLGIDLSTSKTQYMRAKEKLRMQIKQMYKQAS